MNEKKFLPLLLTLCFLFYSQLSIAANGELCENALSVDIGIPTDFHFEEGQEVLYINFVANNDSLLVSLTENHQKPLAILSAFDVYHIPEGCESQTPVTGATFPIFYGHSALLTNLIEDDKYILVLKRDIAMSSGFDHVVISFKQYRKKPCPTIVQPPEKLIKNGGFEITKLPFDRFGGFTNGEVCEWKRLFWSPFIEIEANGNYKAAFWCLSGTNGAASQGIYQELNFTASTEYTLSFDLNAELSASYHHKPKSFRAFLIKKSVLTSIPADYNSFKNFNNNQEIVNIPGAQVNASVSEFSFCFTANDNYDAIYFFPDPSASVAGHTVVYFDNVDVREFTVSANAGPDVNNYPCDLPKQIGPAHPIQGATYSWSPTTGLSESNVANPYASPSSTTTYTLTTSIGNCSATDQVTVTALNTPAADFVFPDGKDIAWGRIKSIDIDLNQNTNKYESSNASFYIDGELTVDADWTLSNCKLWMGENASIKVINGATFKFNGTASSFIKSCASRWDGIYADNNSSIEISDAHPFRHADNGIVSLNGADLLVNQVDFEQNKRCITSSSTAAARPQVMRIQNNHFSCTPPLQKANGNYYYPNKVMVVKNLFSSLGHPLQGSGDLLIENNQFEASAGFITLENSTLTLKNNAFSQFNFIPGQANYPGDPSFSNVAIAVTGKDDNTGSIPQLTAIGNTFLSTRIAIRSNDHTQLYLVGNFMNKNASGTIFPSVAGNTFLQAYDNYPPGSGNARARLHNELSGNELFNVFAGFLFYNTDEYFQINHNNIRLSPNEAGIGILVDASSNVNTAFLEIKNNTINSPNKGMVLKGVIINPGDFSSNEIKEVRTHTNNCNFPPCQEIPGIGIQLFNSSVYLSPNNSVVNSHYSNNISLEGIVLDYCTYNITCNKVENMGTGIRFNGFNSPINTTSSFNYNRIKDCHWGLVLSNYGELGINGNSSIGTGMLWETTVNPYLGEGIRSINNTDGGLSSLYLSSVSLPGSNNADASSTVLSIPTASGTILSNCTAPLRIKKGMNNRKNKLQQALQRKVRIASNASLEKYEAQLHLLQINRDTSFYQDSLFSDYRDSLNRSPFGQLMKNQRTALAQQQLVLLDSFDLSVAWVQTMEQQVKQGQALTAHELQTLRALAQNCPTDKGMAVHQARSLLGKLGEYHYRSSCEVFSNNTLAAKKGQLRLKQANTEVTLFPNPANEQLSIQIQSALETTVELCIYNILGERVACYALNSSANLQHIPTSQLPNGFYVYQLKQDQELLKRGKLQIQH